MNKEALLNIIINDIKEVESLLKSFQGNSDIPSAFINLTERKLNHISEEFSLLKSLTKNPSSSINEDEKNIVQETQVNNIIENKDTAPAIEDIKSSATEELKPEPIIKEEKPVAETHKVIEEIKVEAVTEEKSSDIAERVETPKSVQIESVIINKEETIPTNKEVNPKEGTATESSAENTKTIGDTFLGEKKSVIDLMSGNKESAGKKPIMGKPVKDLTKGLGINDRFFFQRELFNGNSDLLSQTLKQLNDMPDFQSAKSFLLSNFNWEEDSEITQSFFNYVKRKFPV